MPDPMEFEELDMSDRLKDLYQSPKLTKREIAKMKSDNRKWQKEVEVKRKKREEWINTFWRGVSILIRR